MKNLFSLNLIPKVKIADFGQFQQDLGKIELGKKY